ncbi:HYC_CC_PP family protein [Chitinophaga japonensis]|uniref:Uncharacterized protein n=1 Tax=Chitinophaga japonensis TaxID=104662 RepID=A0A562SPL1_CHIJA|nr:hypothetical protein LX66_5174 [Chitinophaga japonensis]
MQRVCSVILALLYLCFTSGVTIYQHYCMGKLESVSIFHGEDRECSICGMKKHTDASKGCCKDVTLSSGKSDDYHISSHVLATFNTSVIFTPLIFNITVVQVSIQKPSITTYMAHAPPLQKQPLFLQFRNFRI